MYIYIGISKRNTCGGEEKDCDKSFIRMRTDAVNFFFFFLIKFSIIHIKVYIKWDVLNFY